MPVDDQNEADVWESDVLGRAEEALFLIDFLTARSRELRDEGKPKSLVLNLDAAWGQGKTFFLDRLRKSLEQRGHLVAFVNAWEDDHADDPILPVMAAINSVVDGHRTLKPKTRGSLKKLAGASGRIALAFGKGLAETTISRYAGNETISAIKGAFGTDSAEIVQESAKEGNKAFDKVIESEGDALMKKFESGQKSIKDFKRALSEFLRHVEKDDKGPLFILVDELDRCRPNYAIALLERVKHLFELDNVVFVIATDTEQLRHAVSAVYGVRFDAQRYLLRFFDRTYTFQPFPREKFVGDVIAKSGIDLSRLSAPADVHIPLFIEGAFASFGLTLRDTEQALDILKTVVTAWNQPVALELVLLLPLVVAAQQRKFAVTYEAMKELADLSSGREHLWSVVFPAPPQDWRTQNSRLQDEKISGLNLFGQFIATADKPLSELIHFSRSSGTKRSMVWIAEYYQKEAQFHLHSRGLSAPSLVLTYPEIVASAGRLVPNPIFR